MPGIAKTRRLDENLGAVEIELAPVDLRDFEDAASKVTTQGALHSEGRNG